MKPVSRLQYITNSASLAEQACKGGVDWVQLRLKNVGHDEFLAIASATHSVCKRYNAKLIINDNVAIAKEIGADGVHLGKLDMPAEEARVILGDKVIIGCTANTRSDIYKYSQMPIDYIGLGPFRHTQTKEKLAPILGVNGYRRILESLRENSISNLAIVGVGGITDYDIEDILGTGIFGIAVSSAISNAPNIIDAATKFKTKIDSVVRKIKFK